MSILLDIAALTALVIWCVVGIKIILLLRMIAAILPEDEPWRDSLKGDDD